MPYKVAKTGRWAAQARDADGKRIQLGTHATRRDAVAAERDYARRVPQSDVTVSEWRKVWLANTEWRESTRTHNAERTSVFAAEHGDRKLARINRTIARDFIAAHPSCHGALSAMFGAAAYADDEHGDPLLTVNPFAKLVKRTVRRRDLKSEWLEADDVVALEDTARGLFPEFGDTAAAMIRFAAEVGLRPGELYALQHDDLFGADGAVRIARAADSKTRRVGLPKNGQAREVVLSKRALLAAGEGEGLVFATPRGRQFWNTSWGYYWKQIRCAAGRPTMDFYELRHYCATRLLEAGLDYPDVAHQLGHTDGGELVRTVYGHPSKRRALARVRAALDTQEA
jgi:integrase